MEHDIMVSINCVTYNHEKYIVAAIESFLMQKTNFAFEILIYDDASTDSTAKIIKEYQAKYPDVIKPIYQTENQYSKGVNVTYFNLNRVKGKYIANCEGDDFWVDPHKLQKQVDYMEMHPECTLCTHAAHKISPDNTPLRDSVRLNKGSKIFTVEDVIGRGGGLFPTNSMLYPARFVQNRPAFCEKALATDYPLTIYLALNGTVYYIDAMMSSYRVNVQGSWTRRMKSSISMRVEHYEKRIEMFNLLNEYTDYKYDNLIKKNINNYRFIMLFEQGMYKELRNDEFDVLYRFMDTRGKFKLFVKQYFPYIAKFLMYIKNRYGR